MHTTNLITIFTRGNKFFELCNHLGNVLVTVSDNRLQITLDKIGTFCYLPEVVTAQDYYPFGSLMPGRKYSIARANYRYGFNGKENDNETSSATTYDYGFSIYSPALGRFLSVDPLTNKCPWYTLINLLGINQLCILILMEKKKAFMIHPKTPYFLKGIWDNAVDGFGNLLLKLTINQTEGLLIRKQLEKDGVIDK